MVACSDSANGSSAGQGSDRPAAVARERYGHANKRPAFPHVNTAARPSGRRKGQIWKPHGLKFKTVAIDLPDEDAAKDWIDANQLGRRNLPPHLASLLRGRIYNREKKAVHDGGKGKARSGDQNDPHLKTSERLAAQFGVDEKTIRRDGKRADALAKLAETHPEACQ